MVAVGGGLGGVGYLLLVRRVPFAAGVLFSSTVGGQARVGVKGVPACAVATRMARVPAGVRGGVVGMMSCVMY